MAKRKGMDEKKFNRIFLASCVSLVVLSIFIMFIIAY